MLSAFDYVTVTGLPLGKMREAKKFGKEDSAKFSKRVVQFLGTKKSYEAKAADILRNNGVPEAFVTEAYEYFRRHGKDLKPIRVITKDEAATEGISGRYFPKS